MCYSGYSRRGFSVFHFFVFLMSRQSDAYKQQQIVLYNNPNQNQNKEEEKEEDYDLGSVSYYYPPFNSNSFMEPASHESEESEMSFQEQMRETGMRGIPPLEDDDHMCEW